MDCLADSLTLNSWPTALGPAPEPNRCVFCSAHPSLLSWGPQATLRYGWGHFPWGRKSTKMQKKKKWYERDCKTRTLVGSQEGWSETAAVTLSSECATWANQILSLWACKKDRETPLVLMLERKWIRRHGTHEQRGRLSLRNQQTSTQCFCLMWKWSHHDYISLILGRSCSSKLTEVLVSEHRAARQPAQCAPHLGLKSVTLNYVYHVFC
jgi:hypothetical protein